MADDDVQETVETGQRGEALKDLDKMYGEGSNEDLNSQKFIQAAAKLKQVSKDAVSNESLDTVNKDDIAFVMNEMNVGKLQAEKALRSANGNLQEAIIQLINA